MFSIMASDPKLFFNILCNYGKVYSAKISLLALCIPIKTKTNVFAEQHINQWTGGHIHYTNIIANDGGTAKLQPVRDGDTKSY